MSTSRLVPRGLVLAWTRTYSPRRTRTAEPKLGCTMRMFISRSKVSGGVAGRVQLPPGPAGPAVGWSPGRFPEWLQDGQCPLGVSSRHLASMIAYLFFLMSLRNKMSEQNYTTWSCVGQSLAGTLELCDWQRPIRIHSVELGLGLGLPSPPPHPDSPMES